MSNPLRERKTKTNEGERDKRNWWNEIAKKGSAGFKSMDRKCSNLGNLECRTQRKEAAEAIERMCETRERHR